MKSFRICKKVIPLFLTTSLSLGILSGCSTTEETEQPSEIAKTNQTDQAEQIERTKITYWDSFCADMLPDSYCESLIEAVFPVDIVVDRTSELNINGLSNMLTQSNVPDIFWTEENSTFIQNLDIFRSIPREMVEEYAPSFLQLYEEYPTLYTSIMHPDSTDEFFALSGATEQSAAISGSLYADFYRYDWIESLGIDLGVNVTQISENFYVADNGLTLDKFEEVMDGFTHGDPDGNGVDDTFGASFEYMSRFELLYSGFNMTSGVNNSNGEPKQFFATDNFKDFSIWFSDMFSKGYFDDEFYYQDRTDRWEKVNNEEYGYFLESSIAINSWASDRPPLSLLETNPDATFLITPGLSNNEGQGTIIKNSMPTLGSLCFISKNVDDEKLILILQMLEHINFGDDIVPLWFGEENVDWAYQDDGSVENISNLEISEKGSRIFVKNVMVGDLFKAISVEPVFAAGADFWLYDCIWRENDREQYQYKIDLLNETNYDDLRLLYGDKCNAVYQSYFENWVYNGLDVEDSWESYLQELDEAGHNIMMEELDKVQPLEELILQFIS